MHMARESRSVMHTGYICSQNDVETGALAHLRTAENRDVPAWLHAAAQLFAHDVAEEGINEEKEPAKGQHLFTPPQETACHVAAITAPQELRSPVTRSKLLEVSNNGCKQTPLLHDPPFAFAFQSARACRT